LTDTRPDQPFAILVNGHTLEKEFSLQDFQAFVVKAEFVLQGAIGEPSVTLQERHDQLQNPIQPHGCPFHHGASVFCLTSGTASQTLAAMVKLSLGKCNPHSWYQADTEDMAYLASWTAWSRRYRGALCGPSTHFLAVMKEGDD
jgi:hypothetical protein